MSQSTDIKPVTRSTSLTRLTRLPRLPRLPPLPQLMPQTVTPNSVTVCPNTKQSTKRGNVLVYQDTQRIAHIQFPNPVSSSKIVFDSKFSPNQILFSSQKTKISVSPLDSFTQAYELIHSREWDPTARAPPGNKWDPAERVRLALINWQTQCYAENPFLMKIPRTRIESKRKELCAKYGAKN